ncbi:MAG: hypothetical protein MK010_03895 [Erythrobacter sp.]|nr:hypothetical protein [Erythrobacter sp.]
MKPRPPLSIHAAITRVVGQLPEDWDSAAEATGRKPHLLRKYSDPDRREELPVSDAIALDLAYIAAGGQGAPIFEAYAYKLELAELAQFADRIELHRKAIDVIREGGEAHAALVRACQPDATSTDRDNAVRECSEAFDELGRVLNVLSATNHRNSSTAHQRAPP